jgi:hypothetical protein
MLLKPKKEETQIHRNAETAELCHTTAFFPLESKLKCTKFGSLQWQNIHMKFRENQLNGSESNRGHTFR